MNTFVDLNLFFPICINKNCFLENILKARKKLRDAESESELFTEEEERPVKRRRKVCKRFSFSDDSNDDQDCPSKIVSSLKVPDVPECLKSTSSQPQTSSLFSSSLLDGTIEGLQTGWSNNAEPNFFSLYVLYKHVS